MARAYVYDMVDTWNAGATTFTAIKMNVTDTASAAASLLMDLQVGGSSQFKVTKNGVVTLNPALATGGVLNAGTNAFKTIQFGSTAFGSNGIAAIRDGEGVVVRGSQGFAWENGANDPATGTIDLRIVRDAANTLAQRNGVNAQTFRVYNTYTDASNYERGVLGWSGNNFRITTEHSGTGSARKLQFGIAGSAQWEIDGNLLAVADNTYDIGQSGANRPRNIYSGSGVWSPYLYTTSGAGAVRAFWYSSAADVMSLGKSTGFLGGSLELTEDTAPAAPSTNAVRIYAEDNGAGKTRIMARFATGAAVQIAIEP